jgi:hypothetical protein
MTIQIKFSHVYNKMPLTVKALNEAETRLVGVSICDVNRLPPKFVEWDTAITAGGHYELPKGQVIVLTLATFEQFREELPDIWTTIRRATPEKATFYQSAIGERVEVVFT